MMNEIELPNNVSNDNLMILDLKRSNDAISEQSTNSPNRTPPIVDFDKDETTIIEKFFVFLNHVLIQISLLSFLEPMLFFYYIVDMEKSLFYEQLDSFVIHTLDLFDENTIQKIKNQAFYPLIFDFLTFENIYVDSLYNELKHNSEFSQIEQEKLINSLFEIAFRFCYIINIINIFYSLTIKYFFNHKIIPMLFHHCILIIFIGLYEIWFFQNVVLKYLPWSKDEILFYIFQCVWLKYEEHFPELKNVEQNITMSCNY